MKKIFLFILVNALDFYIKLMIKVNKRYLNLRIISIISNCTKKLNVKMSKFKMFFALYLFDVFDC